MARRSCKRSPQPSCVRKWHSAVCKSSFTFFIPCDPATAFGQEEIQKLKWWPGVTAVNGGRGGSDRRPRKPSDTSSAPSDTLDGSSIWTLNQRISPSCREPRKHIPWRGSAWTPGVPVDVRGVVPRSTGLSAGSLFLSRRWESRGR